MTHGRHCDLHAEQQRQASLKQWRETPRSDTQFRKFYCCEEWRRTRAAKLAKNPLCEECEERQVVTAATHVHHMQPVKERWDLRLDARNLRSLCHKCHEFTEKRTKTPGWQR